MIERFNGKRESAQLNEPFSNKIHGNSKMVNFERRIEKSAKIRYFRHFLYINESPVVAFT